MILKPSSAFLSEISFIRKALKDLSIIEMRVEVKFFKASSVHRNIHSNEYQRFDGAPRLDVGNHPGPGGSSPVLNLALCLSRLLFLPLWVFLVESPMWLLQRDKEKEAITTLRLLRGEDYVVDEEIGNAE